MNRKEVSSAAVLQSKEKRSRLRLRLESKCQSSKFEIPVEAEKRALSANYIFTTTIPRTRAGKTHFWVKGGVNA